MLRLFKWLLGFLVTLSVLVLAAVVIIPMVFDPNDYRDNIITLVKDKTGRDLKLDGELTMSVFPWLGIRTEGLALSQPEEIGGDMLSVSTAQLRIKLAPLLSKQVHIDTVILEQPQFRLVTLKDGMDSFSGLTGDDATDEDVADDTAGAAVALAIQGVEITNALVVLDNRQEDSLLELSNLNVTTGNLIGDSLADIKLTGQMKDSASPDITQFDVTAKALINTETFDVQASGLLAQVKQGDFDIDLTLDSMTFKQSSQIEVSGLNVEVKGAHAVQASMPSLVANLDAQTATIETLSAKYQNIDAVVSTLKVSKFIDQPSATGRLTVAAFDARQLVKDLELDFEPSDPQVLKAVGLSADFAGSLDGAVIQKIVVNLDDTALTGSASVVNFENPKLKFDLNLTDLNLDSYLPEDTEEEEAISGGEALAVPMAAFKDINANGTFKASKLISGGVVLTDIDVVVKSTPGNVSITPRAKLYEGKIDGAIVFNQSGDKSSLTVKNEIDLVQLSPLFTDAADSDQLRGIGTLGLDLVVTDVNGVQSNEGTIELRATEGALLGIDLVTKVVDGLNTISNLTSGQKAESSQVEIKGEKTDATEFSELLGTFHLKDFLVKNDDLKLTGPGFEITGAGQFDLDKESIDYRVNLLVLEGVTALGGDGVQNALGKTPSWAVGKQIPIRCTGTFESPTCLPDVKALYSLYVGGKIDGKKSEFLKDKLGIKTEDGKKVRTKDIFKQLLLKETTEDDDAQKTSEAPTGELDGQASAEEGQGSTEPVKEKTKKELRDERKKKLLESIFN